MCPETDSFESLFDLSHSNGAPAGRGR